MGSFKAKVRIKDTDPGFRKLRKRFKGPSKVDVGVFGEQGSDIVMIAATNEFGTDSAGKNKNVVIPERSFIRAGTDEAKDEFRKFLRDGTIKVLKGKLTKRQLIGRLGLLGEKKIKEKMVAGPFVPNAPSTMRKKGKGKGVAFSEIATKQTGSGVNKPLIDTGRLRGSITSRIEGKVKIKGKKK